MSDPYLGEIRFFAGNFPPQGWAFCNGQQLTISENEALFSLLGTTYGGDGQTTFGLPDLRGRIPLHRGTSPSDGNTYVLGQQAGTETVKITQDQLPIHTHSVYANPSTGDQVDPTNNVWGLSNGYNQYIEETPNGSMSGAAISSAGGNQPHDNMMPYLVFSFIIALEGLYPSQN